MLTSSPRGFSSSLMSHGDSVALTLVLIIVHGSVLSCEHFHRHSPLSPFFHLPLHSWLGHETCLRSKNGANDASYHHRCHCCLLFWISCNDCNLRPEPTHQHILHGCPCGDFLSCVALLALLRLQQNQLIFAHSPRVLLPP
jgi:hypothetical protein